MSNPKDAASKLMEIIEPMEARLRDVLLREVDRKIEFHRRAVWVRDEWCCKPMETFALQFWAAPRPKRDYEFGTTLQIRGAVVNYCPFCGVFVGKADKP